MDPVIITTIVLCVAAVASMIVAYVQWRENHSDRKGGKLDAKIKTLLALEAKPIEDRLNTHATQLVQAGDRLNRIEGLLKDNNSVLREFSENMSRMGVKVDMYWATLEALAMNSAKGLHQPDPRRAHVDHLLEAFMEGTLTADERLALRKILVKIRNYEPGTVFSEFPIVPGEQTYAAILLSTMDLVDPRKMAAMGHAAHRAHGRSPDLGE